MSQLSITEFTDPVCPWAYSAEPHRLRLRWTYGDAIDWTPRMVVLSDDPAEVAERFTPQALGKAMEMIGDRFGMPIYSGGPERLYASKPACQAVVATRLNRNESTYPLLRELRKRCFAGELLDEPEVIASAAAAVGLDTDELATWSGSDESRDALESDMTAARTPTSAALAVKRKLAETPEGGWRYTCPSYELSDESSSLSAPGFQPYETYETAVANLAPDLSPKAPAGSAQEALEWARDQGEGSLATVEVAALMGQDLAGPGSDLSQVISDLESTGAAEHPVGASSLWELKQRRAA